MMFDMNDGYTTIAKLPEGESAYEFKAHAKREWISAKRKSGTREVRRFLKAVGAKFYYAHFGDDMQHGPKDDSVEVWYTL